MVSSDERREVAERLREAAIDDGHVGRPYGEQGFQVTLRRIIGTSNPTRPTLYARLADLIDPTCEVESVDSTGGLLSYRLSCGHTAYRPTYVQGPPPVCPGCGARVVTDDGID